MTDDTRERFLREITAQVPADRIAELHLFRPLRRGGTETGVAVIAVEQESPVEEPGAPAPVFEAVASDEEESGDEWPVDEWPVDENSVAALDESPYADEAAPALSGGDVELESELVAHADAADLRADATSDADTIPVVDTPTDDGHSAPADVHASTSDVESDRDADHARLDADAPAPGCAIPAGTADVSLARAKPARLVRHTVFTARYRLTRKGADRGKWEFEVVADAEAPLGTVDMVVRGVQRRAGDDEEPERLTAEGVRAALDGQAWQRTT